MLVDQKKRKSAILTNTPVKAQLERELQASADAKKVSHKKHLTSKNESNTANKATKKSKLNKKSRPTTELQDVASDLSAVRRSSSCSTSTYKPPTEVRSTPPHSQHLSSKPESKKRCKAAKKLRLTKKSRPTTTLQDAASDQHSVQPSAVRRTKSSYKPPSEMKSRPPLSHKPSWIAGRPMHC